MAIALSFSAEHIFETMIVFAAFKFWESLDALATKYLWGLTATYISSPFTNGVPTLIIKKH